MGEVTKLTYLLKCHKCSSNNFCILLNSYTFKDVRDIKFIECTECGKITVVEVEE